MIYVNYIFLFTKSFQRNIYDCFFFRFDLKCFVRLIIDLPAFLGDDWFELVTLERLCFLLVVIGRVERSKERTEPLVSCFHLLPIFNFLLAAEPG